MPTCCLAWTNAVMPIWRTCVQQKRHGISTALVNSEDLCVTSERTCVPCLWMGWGGAHTGSTSALKLRGGVVTFLVDLCWTAVYQGWLSGSQR